MNLPRSRSRGRHGLHPRDDRGATAVEYGLMVALIAVVIVLGVTAFGLSVQGLFQSIVLNTPFFN